MADPCEILQETEVLLQQRIESAQQDQDFIRGLFNAEERDALLAEALEKNKVISIGGVLFSAQRFFLMNGVSGKRYMASTGAILFLLSLYLLTEESSTRNERIESMIAEREALLELERSQNEALRLRNGKLLKRHGCPSISS